MTDPEQAPEVADEVLEAVNDAMVALHARYHGRKPASARTMMMGEDMLACALGDVYTDVEKTMIELERQALVHETRGAFQRAMERRFIAEVERLTERRVARFISTHHVGPDLELELFLLEPLTAAPGAKTQARRAQRASPPSNRGVACDHLEGTRTGVPLGH